MRKVNDGGQQPGAPSREGSLLQEPPAQGQPQGYLLASPGIATFDANVVPTASQGQPYRGEKAQQAQSGGEMGRATPPPKTPASDMTDEEIEKLVKEHDVLRKPNVCAIDDVKPNAWQGRSTRRSKDISSNNSLRYTNYKTLSQINVYPFPGLLGTIASIRRDSIVWTD